MKIFYSKQTQQFIATQYNRETKSHETLATADTLDQLMGQVGISDEPEYFHPATDEGSEEDLAYFFEGI